MANESLRVVPDTLFDPDDPMKFLKDSRGTELGYVSFEIMLSALETVAAIRTFGRSAIEILGSRINHEEKIVDLTKPISAERKYNMNEMKATSVRFGLRGYDCSVYLTGSNIMRIAGDTRLICKRGDNGDIIIDSNEIMKGFMQCVYNEISHMVLDDTDMAINQNSPYKGLNFKYIQYNHENGEYTDASTIASLRYLVTEVGMIDFVRDKATLNADLAEIRQQGPAKIKATFVVVFPMAYLPTTMIKLPHYMKIIALDNLTLKKQEVDYRIDVDVEEVEKRIGYINSLREDSMMTAVISIDLTALDSENLTEDMLNKKTGNMAVISAVLNGASILRTVYGLK